jgi:hypothetical protein
LIRVSQQGQEHMSVAECMTMPRIIEVNVNINSSFVMLQQLLQLVFKFGSRVLRGKKLCAAMQAIICKVSREDVMARVLRGISDT